MKRWKTSKREKVDQKFARTEWKAKKQKQNSESQTRWKKKEKKHLQRYLSREVQVTHVPCVKVRKRKKRKGSCGFVETSVTPSFILSVSMLIKIIFLSHLCDWTVCSL